MKATFGHLSDSLSYFIRLSETPPEYCFLLFLTGGTNVPQRNTIASELSFVPVARERSLMVGAIDGIDDA